MDERIELSFEEALRELDQQVERLEGEELTLEEALTCYARAQSLLAHCQQLLATAELKLERLSLDDLPEPGQ